MLNVDALTDDQLLTALEEILSRRTEDHWDTGAYLLALYHRRNFWKNKLEHESWVELVEERLHLPQPTASKLMGVARYFGPAREQCAGIGWSILAEAIGICKKRGLERAIELCKEGIRAVRQERALLRNAGEEPIEDKTWKTLWPRGLRVPPDVPGHAVRREDDRAAARNFVQFLDEDGALAAQVLDDVLVVHDLVSHIDGRAVQLQRTLDDLDRALDAGAETTGIGEQDFHRDDSTACGGRRRRRRLRARDARRARHR